VADHVFAGHRVVLDVSFGTGRARLKILARDGMLLRACHAAYGEGIVGLAQAAGSAAGRSRQAAVRLADTDYCARLALRWAALAADGRAFPALEADLMLSPAGDQIALLAVAGTYRRQPGRAGWTRRWCAGAPRPRSAASRRGSRVRWSTPRGQPVPQMLARAGRQGNKSRNRPVTGQVPGGGHLRRRHELSPDHARSISVLNRSLWPVWYFTSSASGRVFSPSVAVTLACGTDAGRSMKVWEGPVHGAMILEGQMTGTVARVTEISAKSDTSFEDAINVAVSRASQTLRGVTAAWVKEQSVHIEDGRIVAWKVDLLVTFVLE
jgi:dodecin